MKLLFWIFTVVVIKEGNSFSTNPAEDATLDVPGLLKKYGYPFQVHTVQTEDGYILQIHRITGKKTGFNKCKPVVLLMHGLVSSSADWILPGPGEGLAYLLADQGYDVWMGNARGNIYSRKHISISPDDPQFWDYSWHEVGYYDLPAIINKALTVTGQKKLQYIGFSQGCIIFFVMASTRPSYNKKIKLVQALAPPAYMSNADSPFFKYLSENTENINSLVGTAEFIPSQQLINDLTDIVCVKGSIPMSECNGITLFSGYNPPLTNTTMFPVYASHVFAGSSAKQVVHTLQLYKSGKFHQYDYGCEDNLIRYGQSCPPVYPLRKITAPVKLYHAEEDLLVDPIDVDRLNSELGNSLGMYLVPYKTFAHGDFVMAINITSLLYNAVLQMANSFR